MDPTVPTEGVPGDATETTATTVATDTAEPTGVTETSRRLELVAAVLAAVVALEFVALVIGVWGGGPYRTLGDRIEVVSLNMDAKMGLILLLAGMLATLRDVVNADFRAPRSDLGRRTLYVVAGLSIGIAILALIGVGLDVSRTDVTAFGTNAGAAVIHRLAIVLMAAAAAGWSLTALGVRITTTPRT